MSSETKVCKICNRTKPIDEFKIHSANKKPMPHCKVCHTAKYAESNRLSTNRYYYRNKDEINAKAQIRYHANRDKKLAYQKAYCSTSEYKVKRKAWYHEYRKRNRTMINRAVAEYRRERMKTDPAFRMVCTQRTRSYKVFCDTATYKAGKTIDLWGCTPEQFVAHIESQFTEGMSWDKHGKGPGTFQIDHIKPIGLFDLSDPDQQRACFHYTNHQPLWHEDHIAKTNQDILLIRRAKSNDQATP